MSKQDYNYEFFRDEEVSKPKIFKVLDHQSDEALLDLATKRAQKAKIDISSPEKKALFLKAYNRKRLALAGVSKALKSWEVMPSRTEPTDSEPLAYWLNRQANKALSVTEGVTIDFRRPLEFDMILIPDKFL